MLQSIRDRTQGWIAGIIISLLILSFALWGIHSYMVGGSASTTVAKVNGDEITKSQLAVAYERLRRQLQTQYSANYALPPGAEAGLKDRALQTLINIQLLKQASIKQDYRISDQQVDGLLESMPDFQVNGQFSLARFQQVLSTTLFNAGDFLNLLKTSLLIDQPRLGLIFSSFALPNEVLTTVALVNQERDIRYATLATQDYLKQIVTIPASKIEAYYKAHENEFKTPEQVSIEYIELSVNNLMATLHPADADLKSFYNENANSFAQPMQWKIEAILIPVSGSATEKEVNDAQTRVTDLVTKINKGENFNSLVQQHPIGKVGEKLQGWVTINQVPQALQKTVITLTKAGQVSAPVRIESGFVILKAAQTQEPKAQSFDIVKDKVKEAYVRQQADEKFASMRDKLANTTYEHPESLQSAAQALGLTVKSSDLFTKEKGGKDISSHTQIREAAFSNDVLNLKNNSDVIQVGTDTALVLRIKSHVPATLLTLQTVEKQISDKLKVEEADASNAKLVNEIKDKLAKGATSDQIAQEYHLTWNNIGFIGRHATKVDSAILNEAFAMPKPKQAGSAVYSTVKVPNGYAVIALNGVRDGSLNNNHGQYEVFNEQLQNAQGLFEYEIYKHSLEKQSKISIENPQGGVMDAGLMDSE
jgi:peptidyl-prolyl cis-trans isomerase D